MCDLCAYAPISIKPVQSEGVVYEEIRREIRIGFRDPCTALSKRSTCRDGNSIGLLFSPKKGSVCNFLWQYIIIARIYDTYHAPFRLEK